MHNEEVSVHRDQHDGEGGEEHAAGLRGPDQFTEDFLQEKFDELTYN